MECVDEQVVKLYSKFSAWTGGELSCRRGSGITTSGFEDGCGIAHKFTVQSRWRELRSEVM